MLNSRQQAVQNYYEDQYENAGTQSQRWKIIEEYVSRFPSLAFRPDSWFFPLYRSWRTSTSPKSKAMLRAMCRGLISDTNILGGPVDQEAFRRIRLAQALDALGKVKKNLTIRHAYKTWSEGKHDPEYERFLRTVVIETARSLGVAVRPGPSGSVEFGAKLISGPNPYADVFQEFETTIRKQGLARGLTILVARLHGVRDRDLHNLNLGRSRRRKPKNV